MDMYSGLYSLEGFATKKRRKIITSEEKEMLINLCNSGKSVVEVANDLDISYNTASQIVNKCCNEQREILPFPDIEMDMCLLEGFQSMKKPRRMVSKAKKEMLINLYKSGKLNDSSDITNDINQRSKNDINFESQEKVRNHKVNGTELTKKFSDNMQITEIFTIKEEIIDIDSSITSNEIMLESDKKSTSPSSTFVDASQHQPIIFEEQDNEINLSKSETSFNTAGTVGINYNDMVDKKTNEKKAEKEEIVEGHSSIFKEKTANLIKFYESGMTIAEAASDVGIKYNTAKNILRKYKINVKEVIKKLSTDNTEELNITEIFKVKEKIIESYTSITQNKVILESDGKGISPNQISIDDSNRRPTISEEQNEIVNVTTNDGSNAVLKKNGRPCISKEKTAKLIKLYESGTPMADAASHVGIKFNTAKNILRKYEISVRELTKVKTPRNAVLKKKGRPSICKQKISNLIKFYKSGMSIADAASNVGINYNSAKNIIRYKKDGELFVEKDFDGQTENFDGQNEVNIREEIPASDTSIIPNETTLQSVKKGTLRNQISIDRSTISEEQNKNVNVTINDASKVVLKKNGRPCISKEKSDKLIKLYESGIPIADAASDVGMKFNTAKHILRKYEINVSELIKAKTPRNAVLKKKGRPKKDISITSNETTLESVEKDTSVKQIFIEDSQRRSTISEEQSESVNDCSKTVFKKNGRPSICKEKTAKLIKLYESGMPMADAASDVGIKFNTAKNILRKYEINARELIKDKASRHAVLKKTGRPSISKEKKAKLYKSGMSLVDSVSDVGINNNTTSDIRYQNDDGKFLEERLDNDYETLFTPNIVKIEEIVESDSSVLLNGRNSSTLQSEIELRSSEKDSQRRPTTAQEQKFIDLYKSGVSIINASKAVGIKYNSGKHILKVYKKNGVNLYKERLENIEKLRVTKKLNSGRQKICREEKEKLINLYKSGMFVVHAASKLGINFSTAQHIVGRYKSKVEKLRNSSILQSEIELASIEIDSQNPPTTAQEQKFMDLYKSGVSIVNASKAVGIKYNSGKHIIKVYKKNGVDLSKERLESIKKLRVTKELDSGRQIISREEKEKLINLHKSGMFIVHAASKLGMNFSTAQHIIRRYKRKVGEFSEKRKNHLLNNSHGMRICNAAKVLGLNYSTAKNIILRYKKNCGELNKKHLNDTKTKLSTPKGLKVKKKMIKKVSSAKPKQNSLESGRQKISKEKKKMLVNSYQSGTPIEVAAKFLGINCSTAKGIIQIFRKDGEKFIEKRQGGHRKRIRTPEVLKIIEQIIRINPSTTQRQIQLDLKEKGITLSTTAIGKALRDDLRITTNLSRNQIDEMDFACKVKTEIDIDSN